MFLKIPQCQGGGQKRESENGQSEGKISFSGENRKGWARRCENGAFGTEIVRGIRQLYTLGLKRPKSRKIARSGFLTEKNKRHVFGRKVTRVGRGDVKTGRSVLKSSEESAGYTHLA